MKIAIPTLRHSLITEFLGLPSVFLLCLTGFFCSCLVCLFVLWIWLVGWFGFLFWGIFLPLWAFCGVFVVCLSVYKAIQRCSCDCVKPVVSSQGCQIWQLTSVWMLRNTAFVELSHSILVLSWLNMIWSQLFTKSLEKGAVSARLGPSGAQVWVVSPPYILWSPLSKSLPTLM